MEMTVTKALLIALWVAIAESRILGYASLTLRFSPLMTGLVCGIVMGNVSQAMMISATIQLIYMGSVAAGGTLPSEPAIATAIAVPVGLLGNLKPAEAVAIAVPIGLLGSYLYQLRFFFNTFVTKLMDEGAREGNEKKLFFSIMVIPTIISILLFTPLIFVTLYFGAPIVAELVTKLSSGLAFHVLNVVGGGLAALGIAIILHIIGKKQLLLFFFLGYFLSVSLKPLEINTVTYAIFGAIAAGLYIVFTTKDNK